MDEKRIIMTESQDIPASFRATCATCNDTETSEYLHFESKPDFIKGIKEGGWRHRQAGWMCPDCITQQKALRKGEK